MLGRPPRIRPQRPVLRCSLPVRSPQISVDFFAPGYEASYSDLVLKGDISNIQAFDNFAHGIISFHVLEHVPPIERAMSELHRVLHPKGWLLVEVPSVGTPTVDCRGETTDAGRLKCAGQTDHVWKFNSSDFKRRLEDAGFACQWATKEILEKTLEPELRQAFRLNTIQLLCRPRLDGNGKKVPGKPVPADQVLQTTSTLPSSANRAGDQQ